MWRIWSLVLLLVGLTSTVPAYSDYKDHYTDDFAVEIHGGQSVAERVALSHGMHLVKKLRSVENVYHFRHPQVSKRSKRSATDVVDRLENDPDIVSVGQQKLLHRVKRRIIHDKQLELPINYYKDKTVYQRHMTWSQKNGISTKNAIPGDAEIATEDMPFDDPYWHDQWYLRNLGITGGPTGYDVNVVPVWKKGITGRGVVVTILDDGLDHTHPDLKDNYDKRASADYNDEQDRRNDPMPDVRNPDNSHGTRCAGEIGAAANNGVCGVGIAYNANLGGVRMLDGPVTDILEAEAIGHEREYVDIYSASWGPNDDGTTMEGPGKNLERAIKKSIDEGRGGKGSIYVWATGNGGAFNDDCSCDGYVSNIYTISIGSINDLGESTYYSEWCPSTLAVIFTGGSHVQPGDAEYRNPKIKIVTTDLNHDCTLEFQGTSSAAPLAAGCLALVLEANPDLTWRDVQHIIVNTARVPNKDEPGWLKNGAGLHVNHRFGFGALDCAMMVEEAQKWETVPDQHQCEVPADNYEADLAAGGSINQTLSTDACQGISDSEIDHVEHVQIHMKLSHNNRGDLSIKITSPHGTVSEILSIRPNDRSKEGIDFTFMTVHNWNEDPSGDWMLTVTDTSSPDSGNHGHLESWSITLWGYSQRGHKKGGNTVTKDATPNNQDQAHEPSRGEIANDFNKEERLSNTVDIDAVDSNVEGGQKKSQDTSGVQELLKEIFRIENGNTNTHKKESQSFSQQRPSFSDRINSFSDYPFSRRNFHKKAESVRNDQTLYDQLLHGKENPLESNLDTTKIGYVDRVEKKAETEDIDQEIEDLIREISDLIKE